MILLAKLIDYVTETEYNYRYDELATYTYDKLNRLTRENNFDLNETYVYTYDVGGNILSKTTYTAILGPLTGFTPKSTKYYTYETSGWKDKLVYFGNSSTPAANNITYDSIGNPLTYLGHNLVWDRVRLLKQYDSLTFDYNASGIRTRKGTTTYELDGTTILSETGSGYTLRYLYGLNGLVGFKFGDNNYYYEKNLQGDITGIYDSHGTLVGSYSYDAWGKCSITYDTAYGLAFLNPFRYRGYYYDRETGLYYLNSRYYDPSTGRFINADVFVSTGQGINGTNMFAYCLNNPVTFLDPIGYFGIAAALLAAAAVICAATLSGCSAQPTSNVGAAPPYVPSDSTDYNCYAYVLGEDQWKYVGGSPNSVRDYDVDNVAKMVLDDARKDGRSIRTIESYDSPIESNEYRIALRTNKEDYHFMMQHDDGSWSHKPGVCSTRLINGANPSVVSWDVPFIDFSLWYSLGIVKEIGSEPNFYNSKKIIYFAVTK